MTVHRSRPKSLAGGTRIPIDSVEGIPVFDSDEEELEFWRTHEPSPKFLEGAKHMTPEELLASVKTLPQR
jgi:hypothetical protein